MEAFGKSATAAISAWHIAVLTYLAGPGKCMLLYVVFLDNLAIGDAAPGTPELPGPLRRTAHHGFKSQAKASERCVWQG
jgi:hypothetical protein